jgi:hypothetical protein
MVFVFYRIVFTLQFTLFASIINICSKKPENIMLFLDSFDNDNNVNRFGLQLIFPPVIFGALQVTKVLSTEEVKRAIEWSGKDFGKSKLCAKSSICICHHSVV